ncbi:oxygen-independent coproporphyrinogen III oxidase [Brucellaceae bacterium C25G]
MQEEIVRHYASLAVPRYTSYPTAADFNAQVTPRHMSGWLRQIEPDEAISLYLHIPYCRQLCHYCGCHAKVARREDVIDRFVQDLLAEIALVGEHLSTRPVIGHLHWGGGTPSILKASQFATILNALKAHFEFDPLMEHAIELDPRTVTEDLAATLAMQGVNRASLGVQDVEPEVQKAIGRIQPLSVVQAAVDHLRGAGIQRINFDLIYGLPLQTEETLRQTCQSVHRFKPDRIAFYGYAHLPQRRANQRLINDSALPDADARYAQAGVVRQCFKSFGYEEIGIDHFALPDDPIAVSAREGRLNRNFQGYTDDNCKTLIGLGPSSISQFRGGFAQNITDIGQYGRAVQDGKFATQRGHIMRDMDRSRADVILSLMCNFQADLNMLASGVDFSDEMALLRPLIADEIVTVKNGVVTMNHQKRQLIRPVAAIFDEFRRGNVHGFSFAV